MPGDDADFEAYLAARWPTLVRSLVLIGLPPAEAEDVVVTGLARCRTAWRRLQDVDDVDAHRERQAPGDGNDLERVDRDAA